MKNNLFRKGLVCIILVMFIGVSVVSGICLKVEKAKSTKNIPKIMIDISSPIILIFIEIYMFVVYILLIIYIILIYILLNRKTDLLYLFYPRNARIAIENSS